MERNSPSVVGPKKIDMDSLSKFLNSPKHQFRRKNTFGIIKDFQ